jgi:hypothetical protein
MDWSLVRFIRSPAVHDVEYALGIWKSEYSAYLRQYSGILESWPPDSRFGDAAKTAHQLRFGPREEPFFGLPVLATKTKVSRTAEISTIELWCSQVPRLVWSYDELTRQRMPPLVYRRVIRIGAADFLMNERLGMYIGLNTSLFVWLSLEITDRLRGACTGSLESHAEAVTKWIEAAEQVANLSGGPRLICIRTKKQRSRLLEQFADVASMSVL